MLSVRQFNIYKVFKNINKNSFASCDRIYPVQKVQTFLVFRKIPVIVFELFDFLIIIQIQPFYTFNL